MLLLAGVTLIGAVVFAVGAGIVLFIPWFGVLASGVREPSDELPPETSIANSYFGFVFGLLSTQEQKEATRERDGRTRE